MGVTDSVSLFLGGKGEEEEAVLAVALTYPSSSSDQRVENGKWKMENGKWEMEKAKKYSVHGICDWKLEIV